MRHSACGHPSGPAAVRPREQAGHTTASNDSRRSEHFPLAGRGPSTHDRNDARGIAQLLRMGWFRPVHCKSPPAQEVRALLVGRKLVQGKLRGRRARASAASCAASGSSSARSARAGSPARVARARRPARRCWSGLSSRCCGRARRCAPSSRACTARCWRSCASDDGLPPADDGARRRRAGGDHLHVGRSTIRAGSTASKAVGAHFGLTPKQVPVGRDRRQRRDQQGRRRDGAGPLYEAANVDADPGRSVLEPQALGARGRRAHGA